MNGVFQKLSEFKTKPPAIRCPIFKEICYRELCAAFIPGKNTCTICGGEKLAILEGVARSLEQISAEMRRR
jgi:hypothetical protein